MVAGRGREVVFLIDAHASESNERYYGITYLETQEFRDFRVTIVNLVRVK